MALRFFGVVFLTIIVLGFVLHLSGAIIVASLFFGGCVAIGIALIVRSFSRFL